MNWFIDVFAEDELANQGYDNTSALASIRRLQDGDRSGTCEDDRETFPFVNILPEESEHEDGSPLDFGKASGRNIGMRLVKR